MTYIIKAQIKDGSRPAVKLIRHNTDKAREAIKELRKTHDVYVKVNTLTLPDCQPVVMRVLYKGGLRWSAKQRQLKLTGWL